MVHDRQRTRQPKANRTGAGIRIGSEFHRAAAKHFRACLQLHVHFESDRRKVHTLVGQRVIERGFEIEVLDLPLQIGVVCDLDEAVVLHQLPQAALLDHIRDLGIGA